MSDWRDYFRFGAMDVLVHPWARAGGVGPAFMPTPLVGWNGSFPHPYAPSAPSFDWLTLPEMDFIDRVRDVRSAMYVAADHAMPAILEETGELLEEVLAGIIPGLLFALVIVTASTAIGGAGGALVGALGGGVGAVPGGAAGATLGFNVGLALLDVIGLGVLLTSIGAGLQESISLAIHGVQEAWYAVDTPMHRRSSVDHAGRTLARAVAVLVRAILEGIVAYLLAKDAAARISRVTELVAQLKRSRMGEAFGKWVETNWERLLRNDKLKPKAQSSGGGGGAPGSGSGPTATSSSKSAPAPKPAPAKPAPRSGEPAPKSGEPKVAKPEDPAKPAPNPKKSRAQRMDELAKDPDRNNGVPDATTRREAEVAVDLEDAGHLQGPLRRPNATDKIKGDVVDGNGTHWDIKSPRSRDAIIRDIQQEAAANGKTAPKLNSNKKIAGEFDAAKTAEKIGEEFRAGENVIVDTAKMEPTQVNALKSEIAQRGLDPSRILFYP